MVDAIDEYSFSSDKIQCLKDHLGDSVLPLNAEAIGRVVNAFTFSSDKVRLGFTP